MAIRIGFFHLKTILPHGTLHFDLYNFSFLIYLNCPPFISQKGCEQSVMVIFFSLLNKNDHKKAQYRQHKDIHIFFSEIGIYIDFAKWQIIDNTQQQNKRLCISVYHYIPTATCSNKSINVWSLRPQV
jgi:hypothetical protein